MAIDFTWEDAPSQDTPLNAGNLQDFIDAIQDEIDSKAASGVLLDSKKITSNFTRTGAGTSDVTGLDVTVTVGDRPIVIEFEAASVFNTSGSGITVAAIMEGATQLATNTISLTGLPFPGGRRTPPLSLSPGSHTFKISLGQLVTGNSTISASSTDPAHIAVYEV